MTLPKNLSELLALSLDEQLKLPIAYVNSLNLDQIAINLRTGLETKQPLLVLSSIKHLLLVTAILVVEHDRILDAELARGAEDLTALIPNVKPPDGDLPN